MTDSLHSIYQSAKRFFSGTLLSRLSGMLRDMAMAYTFGTQASVAAFMVAYRLAHVCRRLFGEGALQSAFIPEFEALRHQDSKRAFAFFRDLMIVLSLFLVLFITAVSISLGFFLLNGSFPQEYQDIVYLTLLMLPSLLFICLFGLNASLLQCEKCYFIPSVAPVAFNIMWIATVWVLKPLADQRAMPLLAAGVIVACFFQWLLTVPKTLALLKQGLLSSLWTSIRLASPDMSRLRLPLVLGIAGVSASQINNVIDSLFAVYAEPEGPALLWYAIRLQQLPLALFSVAIGGALLPPLARALKAHDWQRYHQFLEAALTSTCTLMLPLTAALLALGDSSVNLIYGRGDFTHASIIGTTHCLWAYGLGLIPTSLILVLAPACYAQSNYRLPALASFLTVGLNFILNFWFIKGLGWGAVSVALATSLSAWVNLFFLSFTLSKKNGPLLSKEACQHIFRIGAASLMALMGTELVRGTVQHRAALNLMSALPVEFPHTLLSQLTMLGYQSFIFMIFLTCCCWFFRIKLLNLSRYYIH